MAVWYPTSNQWIALATGLQAVVAIAIFCVARRTFGLQKATLELQKAVEQARATADVLPEVSPSKGTGTSCRIWLVNASGIGVLLERLRIELPETSVQPAEVREFTFLIPRDPSEDRGWTPEVSRVLMPGSRNQLDCPKLQPLLRQVAQGPKTNLTLKLTVFYRAQGRTDQRSASYRIEVDGNGLIQGWPVLVE